MSDMKTFTVRELDRQPAVVLDACDREGLVRIRRRDGRVYRLEPEDRPKAIAAFPDFAQRRRRVFSKALTRQQAAALDKLLAGELSLIQTPTFLPGCIWRCRTVKKRTIFWNKQKLQRSRHCR